MAKRPEMTDPSEAARVDANFTTLALPENTKQRTSRVFRLARRREGKHRFSALLWSGGGYNEVLLAADAAPCHAHGKK